MVVSAAHPIWVGDEVHGAVVVEETTNRIASLRSQALERLLVVTLAVFALVAAVLLWFATRISNRIRRLSDEAEAAIDARGRVTRLTTASDANDEIGDLSRSFTTVLGRLARYNAYLEALAGRLSHELRTPVAVVRSSLENLHAARTPEETRTYVARAEEGLARLGTILSRMTEASRLEQGLSAAERERFDAAAVVRGCVEGYRLAYATAQFRTCPCRRSRYRCWARPTCSRRCSTSWWRTRSISPPAGTRDSRHRWANDGASCASKTRARRCPMRSAIRCSIRWCRCAASAPAARRTWGWACTSRA